MSKVAEVAHFFHRVSEEVVSASDGGHQAYEWVESELAQHALAREG